jgi:CPA2 family monovalent cation:H+ antiporter-2
VRRKGARSYAPGPDFVFEEGDVVVLLGRPENLALAEQKLLKR